MGLIMKKRIIHSRAGQLIDLTENLYDFYADSTAVTFTSGDYLFIGDILPFNNFFIDATGTNAQNAVMTVACWDGGTWNDVAETIDSTSTGGKSIGRKDFVEFVTNKNKSWAREDTQDSAGDELITGLGTDIIYDRYWSRVSWSATLDEVTLNWIGNVFSDDNDLKAEFPDLVNTDLMDAFESGKTDWEEQHRVAARIVIKDLIGKGAIFDESQILTKEDLTLASVQKTAEIIYGSLGADYVEQRDAAGKEYPVRLNASFVKIDRNRNARLDIDEQIPKTGFLRRR